MQARDFLQPVALLHSRSTLAEALGPLERQLPVFVRNSQGWAYLRPDAVVGYPCTRQMLDLPLEPIVPVPAESTLDDTICRSQNSPIAVAESGHIIGCLDPFRIERLRANVATDSDEGLLLLRAIGPLTHDLANALFVLESALAEETVDMDFEGRAGRTAIKHTASLLNRLRAICAGDDEGAPEQLDVCLILSNMLTMLQLACGNCIRVGLKSGATLPPVRVYERTIERSLLNLVLNARDAMQHAGQIELSTRVDEAPTHSSVVIRIEDDGPGLKGNSMAIFEPGFSSKSGNARGFGLDSVVQALSRIGGTVQVAESTLGGAAFEIWLPASSR